MGQLPVIAATARPATALCALWDVVRVDGTTLRFTSNSAPIEYDGNTYTPANSFQTSETQRQAGASADNTEILGIISSDAITDDDLRAGLYRGARITERIVDSRYPWAGAFTSSVYLIDETSWTGRSWEAQLVGLASLLARRVGYTFSESCNAVFGDDRCKLNENDFKTSLVEVTEIVTPFLSFKTDLDGTQSDGYFDRGKVVWQGTQSANQNLNTGLHSQVKAYVDTDGVITLIEPTEYAVNVGDVFDVYQSCAYTRESCKAFGNIDNFRGWGVFMPGNEEALDAPDAK